MQSTCDCVELEPMCCGYVTFTRGKYQRILLRRAELCTHRCTRRERARLNWWTARGCTWRPHSSELEDYTRVDLETALQWSWRSYSSAWGAQLNDLGDRTRVNLEDRTRVNLETILKL
jgi:hypothetical protein